MVRKSSVRVFGMSFNDITFISSFVKICLTIQNLKWGENRDMNSTVVSNYCLPPLQEKKNTNLIFVVAELFGRRVTSYAMQTLTACLAGHFY
jgi:hypothetical protein